MQYLLTHTIQYSAERFPDKDAFRFGRQSLTFASLFVKANQLANLLHNLGVKKGDRIGIYMPRCLETAIAIYGIMRAGAVYVPLNTSSPILITQLVIKDCGIQHLVVIPAQKKSVKKLVANTDSLLTTIIGFKDNISIATFSWEEVFQLPSYLAKSVRLLETDLAYIMYTSGSTGQPKGIMHTHHSGLSYAKLSARLYDLNKEDIVGNHCALHYDMSTFGYFSSPLVGATTIIISDAHTKMPASLSLLMEQEKMTVWYSIPLALIQLLQKGVLEHRNLSALRWVLFGGEPFAPKFLKGLMNLWPQAKFSNVYGPAEVNQCTFYTVPSSWDGGDMIPIGQVWDNTEMLVVDEEEKEVGVGAIGELLIRSATMMKGYWKRPDLTKKSIYKRYRWEGVEECFYRTGDLVTVDRAGNLLFKGRKDRQIKTRGYRVELDEVEHVLTNYRAVEEGATFSVKNDEGTSSLKAVIVLKSEQPYTEKELFQYLRKHLPEYALPVSINIIQKLPRTQAGKVDRSKLDIE